MEVKVKSEGLLAKAPNRLAKLSVRKLACLIQSLPLPVHNLSFLCRNKDFSTNDKALGNCLTNLARQELNQTMIKNMMGRNFLVINGKKAPIFSFVARREDKDKSSDLPWKEKTRPERMKLRHQSLVLNMQRYYPV